MAKKPGRLTKVYYSTNLDTPDWININNIVDATLNLEQSELEVTTHDDGAWQSFIAGRKGGTIDLSMRYDDADTSQDALRTSYWSGTTLKFRFRMDEGTGIEEYICNGFLTSVSPAGPNDDPAGFDIAIRISGAVVMQSQI